MKVPKSQQISHGGLESLNDEGKIWYKFGIWQMGYFQRDG